MHNHTYSPTRLRESSSTPSPTRGANYARSRAGPTHSIPDSSADGHDSKCSGTPEHNDRVRRRRSLDLIAVAAAILAGFMAVVYVWIIKRQGDQPLVWVLSILVGSAGLAACGAARRLAHRRVVLTIAGAVLTVLGLLAILSIGLPIIAAGLLALISAARCTASVDRPKRPA